MLQQENTHPNQQVVIVKLPENAGEDAAAAVDPEDYENAALPQGEVVGTSADVDEILQLWLRRCRRKFLQGITVIKVCPNGKLVKRQLYIGAKPEYLELISSKLFDTAYHIGSVTSVQCSLDSPDFDAFRSTHPTCMAKQDKSLVLTFNEAYLSLVFQSVSDRRDAQLYLSAQSKMFERNGAEALREYELVTTLPTMKTNRELHSRDET